jgi:hypothetical protein
MIRRTFLKMFAALFAPIAAVTPNNVWLSVDPADSEKSIMVLEYNPTTRVATIINSNGKSFFECKNGLVVKPIASNFISIEMESMK